LNYLIITNIAVSISFISCSKDEEEIGRNVWRRTADIPNENWWGGLGFSIGDKGYVKAGRIEGNDIDHFWEYDPVSNRWTQKADFAGEARYGAVGFSIENKGYVGTGGRFTTNEYYFYKDFWEYDPVSNKWTQIADFPGDARTYAVGFSIDNKGYVGTGFIWTPDIVSYKDFWEYDPVSNKWKQKADFAGRARGTAVCFSIRNKGYIGLGNGNSSCEDFWEYNPISDVWLQTASLYNGGGNPIGFSIDNKGYVRNINNDLWEYDAVLNIWSEKADFENNDYYHSPIICFSIKSKGYVLVVTRLDNIYEFWEYIP